MGFVSRRWNKASNDLQSHVISSRSRKSGAMRSTVASTATHSSSPPPTSGGSLLGTIGDRVSRIFSGSRKETTSDRQLAVPSTTSKSHPKRSYGFATSNLSNFSDQHSEDLYRYKNISSDYMRETSPTRDNDQPATASGTTRSATRRNDNADQPPVASGARRPVPRRYMDDDHSAGASNTGRGVAKRNSVDEDDKPIVALSTGRFIPRQNDDGNDQPVGTSSTGHSEPKQNDGDADDKDVVTTENL
jgi:hypothetical protein